MTTFKQYLTEGVQGSRKVKKGEKISVWSSGMISNSSLLRTVESVGFRKVSQSSVDVTTRRIIDHSTYVYVASKDIPKQDMEKIMKEAFGHASVNII